ncbi:McrB family protein [Vibrio maerlii]|uniref:McrB family protein n=1 Tax=Vibrio maerlii TaxID=2231648 RepID=UPI000E3EE1CC|nr:AAA family ATPase [Vibrio maerlii]
MIIDEILALGVEEHNQTLHPEIRAKVSKSTAVTSMLKDYVLPLIAELLESGFTGLKLGSEGVAGTSAAQKISALKFYINNKTWIFSIEFRSDLFLTFSARQQMNDLFSGYSDFVLNQSIVNKKDHYSAPFSQELWKKFRTLLLTTNRRKRNITLQSKTTDRRNNIMRTEILPTPLNQILFGPPGTGKTYQSIEAAVKAVEPAFKWKSRDELKAKYEQLVIEQRIRFITFHQSYGYEEFVEGLSAKTDNGEISYYQKDGVFKCIVEDAKDNRITKITEEISDFETLWNRFLNQLSSSENGVRVDTIRTFFTVSDVDSNTVRFEKDKGESNHSLSVKTLKSIFNGDREMKGGLNPYYTAMVKHLKGLAQSESEVKTSRKNYALVIDEINRGNISKIFGELITLIEPSKREGSEEWLEVNLPYSGDTFSVPDNLYIIGTMNTADRSLAMMDTALRRRFDFKEMMPQPELFEGRKVKGIDLTELLKKLNQRIEVLYDREHTLGHAFLFPVYNEDNEENAFIELQKAFKNKIIPLLEEYFYEDWNKIRLVLGDSLKSDQNLCFLAKQEDMYSDLFGSNHDLELYEDKKITYSIKSFEGDESPWNKPSAYIGIYQRLASDPSESEA